MLVIPVEAAGVSDDAAVTTPETVKLNGYIKIKKINGYMKK